MGIPTLRTCHFEASEDIMTKFQSQALHITRLKYWNSVGSGNLPYFIPALWNISILLHKLWSNILSPIVCFSQTSWFLWNIILIIILKHFQNFCRDIQRKLIWEQNSNVVILSWCFIIFLICQMIISHIMIYFLNIS